MCAWSDWCKIQRRAWAKPERFTIPYLHFTNNNTQGRTLYCAKSFAYVNNMPWGLVKYEYKGPRCAPPLALYSWLPLTSDPMTRPPTPRGIQVFGAHPPDFVWFGLIPSQSNSPYLIYILWITIPRAEYNTISGNNEYAINVVQNNTTVLHYDDNWNLLLYKEALKSSSGLYLFSWVYLL